MNIEQSVHCSRCFRKWIGLFVQDRKCRYAEIDARIFSKVVERNHIHSRTIEEHMLTMQINSWIAIFFRSSAQRTQHFESKMLTYIMWQSESGWFDCRVIHFVCDEKHICSPNCSCSILIAPFKAYVFASRIHWILVGVCELVECIFAIVHQVWFIDQWIFRSKQLENNCDKAIIIILHH